MHFLYSLLMAAAFALLLPYFLLRGPRKYLHNLGERLGRIPRQAQAGADGRKAIWVHAVSVGEVLAAIPLARALHERFPQFRILVSTTTQTGQQLARDRLDASTPVFYFPLDFAFVVRRVLRAVQPALVVIAETEIWPNFLRELRRAGIPAAFVNGRISKRSAGRYQRLAHFDSWFVREVLNDARLWLMQSEEDAARLRSLGADEERIAVLGNLKYDLEPPHSGSLVTWLEEQIARQERWPVLVAGSVLEGEEEPVLAGFDLAQRKWRRALLVLAPRKPARFGEAARLVEQDGWVVQRRSRTRPGDALDENADVFLLDSMGELAGCYRIADAVFVGGSLIAAGGHNILEPACFSKPPVFGPHMHNFAEMAKQFLEAMAAVQVWSGPELGQRWIELIDSPERSQRMGRAARALVEYNRGATERTVARLAALIEK
jgi:3-deoxy-D-manno-octulosonic-acid transferase